jgi:hypothetical protein
MHALMHTRTHTHTHAMPIAHLNVYEQYYLIIILIIIIINNNHKSVFIDMQDKDTRNKRCQYIFSKLQAILTEKCDDIVVGLLNRRMDFETIEIDVQLKKVVTDRINTTHKV